MKRELLKLARPHALYVLAERADARLTAVIAARTGRTRWTMKAADEHITEIRYALQAKLAADEAWLAFMRQESERRSAAKVAR